MTLNYSKYIIFLFLILLCNPVFSQNINLLQKITISAENTQVEKIIIEISKQSGIDFSYNSKAINAKQKITFHAKDKTLKEILDRLSKQINIEYNVIENQIVLKKAKKKPETERYTISGYIKDKETGESMIGATILVEGTSTGTISNSYGFYSLTLPKGEYILEYSYIGYIKHKHKIELDKDTKISFDLQLNSQLLGEVTIETNEQLETLEKSQMSRIKINPKNLNNLPEFAGEVGLIKSLQTLPGIKTHSDGSTFFFVRGGNKDQNLILIDEAPIYNPAHLFGFYSVIIPDVTKDISIYKGDMPVNQGDRLSSIIDIKTKDGNMNRFELNGILNPLIYRFSLEGPIVKEKSSFYTSFRHSNFKWLYRRESPNLNMYFYDINAKLNYQINNNNRIFFSLFYGKDNLTNTAVSELGGIRWANFASTLRWNHIFNSKLFCNSMIYASSYNYILSSRQTNWISAISNLNFNIDFTYYVLPKYTIKFGFNQSFHEFNPGNLTYDTVNYYIPKVPENHSYKSALYLNTEHDLTEKLSYKLGFRLPVWTNVGPTTVYSFDTNYKVTDTLIIQGKDSYITYVNFDPRVSIKYQLTRSSSVKISYGIYHQYLQLLSNSISPFSSFEIWLPSGTNIKPQRADQVALGYIKFFNKLNLELNAEAYYKYMSNQIDYESHANLLLNPLIEGELRFGNAWSYGIELLLKRTKGKLSGWISYTYSRIFKKINDINNNKKFPAFYDRPNDFSIYLSYLISDRFNVSANWIYYTGSAITTPISFYEYNGYTVPLYGDKNNDRLPDYHRLDLALSYRLNKRERNFRHSISFAIYNVYNRINPVSINFNKVETKNGNFVVPANLFGTNEIVITEKYLLGFMPSITYKFKILVGN